MSALGGADIPLSNLRLALFYLKKRFTPAPAMLFTTVRCCRTLRSSPVLQSPGFGSARSVVFAKRDYTVQTREIITKPFLQLSTRAVKSFKYSTSTSLYEPGTNYPLSQYFEMSSKHLSTGSTCPPLVEGKLRIYSMRFCPYAQRALLVAEAKNVPHDVVNCNLKDKPEWLFKLNPGAKVPTFELPQGALYESLVVCDYLDEVHTNRPLHSKDAFRKAEDRILVANFDKVISIYYKIMLSKKDGDAQVTKELITKNQDELKPFEEVLEQRGTTFFGGNEPGMTDYMIWPWFERFPVIKMFFPDMTDYEGVKDALPRIEKWRQAMKEDATVKKLFLGPEIHFKFFSSYLQGSPDYDILDK